MRQEYVLLQGELDEMLASMKPEPVMFLSGGEPMFDSQQDRANRAWAQLGTKLGFDPMTVEPIAGKDQRYFTAVPVEATAQPAPEVATDDAMLAKMVDRVKNLTKELDAVICTAIAESIINDAGEQITPKDVVAAMVFCLGTEVFKMTITGHEIAAANDVAAMVVDLVKERCEMTGIEQLP